MTTPNQENATQETKVQDKEYNFRALEAKYEKKLSEERAARAESDRRLAEVTQKTQVQDEDDDDDEPYVDKKRLNKKLDKFGQATNTKIEKSMDFVKAEAKKELRQEIWLENHNDFYDVLQHADKLAERSPKLAEFILKMPDGFERQQLVYQNIKELGLDKPQNREPTIQEKIDLNRRSPYYQPSNVANAPYASVGDFSESGQKSAYNKMQELKSKLRL